MTTPKKLAIILGWLMLSITALTQMTNNGNVVSVGQVNNGGGGGGGAPLTYSARTDTCVTGSETGCSGLGLSFQMRTTDTVPFAALAPMNSAATDPDFHSYLVMVTDQTTKAATTNWEINQGGQAVFNGNSTLLWVRNVGGPGKIMALDPVAIHAQAAIGANPCVGCIGSTSIGPGTQETNCGNGCTKIASSSAIVFSRVPSENNILYEMLSDNVTLNKLTIQPGCTVATPSACTFSREPYVQFTSDSPVPCGILPSNYVSSGWAGTAGVSQSGTITIAMGGAPDWLPNTAYTFPDSFIFPQTNNGGSPNKAFQATVSGTSGGSEPNWAVSCPNVGQTCTDGTVTWTNIGTIKGQQPGFDVVSYIPTRGCSHLNTRIGKVYRGTNQGANYPNAGTPDPSGTTTTDDDIICGEYGTNPCPLTDTSTIHDGGGDGGGVYGTWTPDTPTGCVTPGTCACTASTGANYRGAWDAGTAYVAPNDTVYDPDNTPHSLYKAKINSTGQAPLNNPTYWTLADQACNSYVWQVDTTLVRPCLSRGVGANSACDGHVMKGYLNYFHGTAGVSQEYSHLYSKPSLNLHANPGVGTIPAQGLPDGYHFTYNNAGTTDQAPIGLSNDDVPTATYAIGPNGHAGPGNLPWYAEFTMIHADLTPCNPPGNCANFGSMIMYRMAHMYNTGSNPNFNIQNNVSAISSDGQFVAITTDMMGTRGSTAGDWIGTHAYALGATMFPTSGNAGNFDYRATVGGTSGGSEPAWSTCQTPGSTCSDGGVTWTNLGAACNQLRAFYAPATSTAFSLDDTMFPLNSNTGTNVFKVTQAGTSYSSLPNWNLAGNWGDTICDDAGHAVNQGCSAGVVQWTNIGPNDCRGDVMLVDLLSAH